MSETFTRIRPPGRGAFGDPLPGTGTQLDIPGCQFAPGASHESDPAGGGRQTITDGTVYAPPGIDVVRTDQMRIRGVLFDVAGDPQDWGPDAGVVITVRKVTG